MPPGDLTLPALFWLSSYPPFLPSLLPCLVIILLGKGRLPQGSRMSPWPTTLWIPLEPCRSLSCLQSSSGAFPAYLYSIRLNNLRTNFVVSSLPYSHAHDSRVFYHFSLLGPKSSQPPSLCSCWASYIDPLHKTLVYWALALVLSSLALGLWPCSCPSTNLVSPLQGCELLALSPLFLGTWTSGLGFSPLQFPLLSTLSPAPQTLMGPPASPTSPNTDHWLNSNDKHQHSAYGGTKTLSTVAVKQNLVILGPNSLKALSSLLAVPRHIRKPRLYLSHCQVAAEPDWLLWLKLWVYIPLKPYYIQSSGSPTTPRCF